MKIVTLENVGFSYEGQDKPALDGLGFEIEEGEFVALVGRNGSGKSTAAKLLNGLVTADCGRVVVLGADASDKQNLFFLRSSVGMVFQNPDNQMVATIVEDDVAFGPENLGVKREEIEERINFALNATDMQAFRTRASEHLSGGQKQRVAIAGVLAIKPKILILDESTSMLDPKGRSEIMEIVKKLNKENGVTVICVTHYMEEAAEADRVIVMREGKTAFSGTPREVFARVSEIEACGLCLPRPAYAFNKFKAAGILKGDTVLTEKELEDRLCELFART